jgi:hypothetical protein
LLRVSNGKPIELDFLIDTLIGIDADEEIKELVRLALSTLDEGLSMRDIAEGIINLYQWRDTMC